MTIPTTGKAFAVLFEDLTRWDVGFFRQVSWKWPSNTLKPVGGVLRRVVREVPRSEYRQGLRVIEKITFGGELVSAELGPEDQYKGRLFTAQTGEFIYSKIRLKQGSVATVPTEFHKLSVSAEYPVYSVKTELALPDYLLLVLRSDAFRNLLDGLSHGGSTKTRIHPHDFERLIIPLPGLDIQRSIVDFWHEAESAVAVAQQNLAKPITELNNRLLALYRNESSKDVIHTRFFALDFKDLDAWDAKSGRAAAFRVACPSFRPMGDFIADATEFVRPFDMPEKAWPVYGVNNKEGVFLNGYQKGETFNAAYKRIRKDWFVHSSIRCNVGSLGRVPDVPEDAITSPEYPVWRLRTDIADPMLPHYVDTLIRTPFFIRLIHFNRVGSVRQRMYFDNLCQLRIPCLPVSEQQAYAQAREKALADLEAGKARLAQARQDVEAMILGNKKVERMGDGRETLMGDQK